MKLKDNAGSDLDARPSSLFSEYELWPLASVLTPKGKLCKDYRRTSKIPGHQGGSQCVGRAKPRNDLKPGSVV